MSLPNHDTHPPPVPTQDWEINSTKRILERALGQNNDQKSDNSSISVVVRNRQQNKKGYVFEEFDIRGSNPIGDRKRQASSYIGRVSRYGVACNCPHAKGGITCKHCVFLLLNEVGVPSKDVLSTDKCQQHLRRYAVKNNWEEDHWFVIYLIVVLNAILEFTHYGNKLPSSLIIHHLGVQVCCCVGFVVLCEFQEEYITLLLRQ